MTLTIMTVLLYSHVITVISVGNSNTWSGIALFVIMLSNANMLENTSA